MMRLPSLLGHLNWLKRLQKMPWLQFQMHFPLILMQLLICGFVDSSSFSNPFNAFVLPLDVSLTLFMHYRETLNAIMTIGHSRVPVYAGNPTNIIGLILVISVHCESKTMFLISSIFCTETFFFYLKVYNFFT